MKIPRLPVLLAVFILALTGLVLLASALRPYINPARALSGPTIDLEAPPPSLDAELYVVRAYYDDYQMVHDLSLWTEPWEVYSDLGFVVLGVNKSELDLLQILGFRVEIDKDATKAINAPRPTGPETGVGGYPTIPGFACYRTVEGSFMTAEDLVAAHPTLADWIDVGDSWEKLTPGGAAGYDMMVLVLTNQNVPGPKPRLFLTSSIHAREYTPAEMSTRFAEYLLNNYGANADVTWLLDYHEIHLMLQANPDGRKWAETGLSWRKNTNNNYCANTNTRGIDLNRNFDFQWGCCGGSSGNECSETYRGPSAASEPETQAVQNYMQALFPDQRGPALTDPAPPDATGVYIDAHSYSRLVLWSWGFTSTPPPNSAALQTLGRKWAFFNQYTPQQSIELYATDGTTKDFAYGDLGIAGYTIEIGTAFFQSCAYFENTILNELLPTYLYAAKASRTPYLTPQGPDAINLSLSSSAVAQGVPVTLTATLDDTRFYDNIGSEPVDNIAVAEYYLDVPHWITTTTPVAFPMSPVDGNFNSSVEQAVAVIDTSSLSVGQHILFVRGRDNDANQYWGAPTAIFLYIIDPAVAPTIQGEVTAADTGLPLNVTIDVGGLFQTNTNPSTGLYSLQVISGTYDITASPNVPGYAPATVTGVTAQDFQTVTQDFQLYPYCSAFSDDVEGGNIGWTVQSPWAITTESSHSPTHSWTDSPGGNYSNGRNVSITSPAIDLTGYTGVTLDFWQICDTEASWDFCNVEVSPNGTTWTTVAIFDGPHAVWEQITLPVPQLDNQPAARIRFRFTSDTSVTDDGWHLDDIRLLSSGPQCVNYVAPEAAFSSTSPDAWGEFTMFTNESTGTALSFAWDFGDGFSSTAANPIHQYPATGTYTVVMTATNDLGSDSVTHTVDILEAPSAGFVSSSPDTLGTPTVFTNTSSGTDLAYLWDFGDSSPPVTDANPTYTYPTAGTFTVTLTASNAVGTSDYAQTVTITETVVAPQAAFEVSVAGFTATFTNMSTGGNLSYLWDFGDDSATVTETHPVHLYAAPGTYTVTLTVTNSAGTSVATQTVVIEVKMFQLFLPLVVEN